MRTDTAPNRYETWRLEWKERFLTLDQEALCARVPGLTAREDCLTLDYFSRPYGIHRETGLIHSLEDESRELTLFTQLNIYTLLWYCREDAVFKNQWMPFRNLKDASPFGPAFQRTVVDVFARTFSGHPDELRRACEALGGRRLPHSDVGYEIPAFACIPVQFLFWDGDDEFPAQGNILFDQSAVEYIHVESLVSIASDGLSLLSGLAGLPLDGNTFS